MRFGSLYRLTSLGLAGFLAFSGCENSTEEYLKKEKERVKSEGDTVQLGIIPSNLQGSPSHRNFGIADMALSRTVLSRNDKRRACLDIFIYLSNEIEDWKMYLDGGHLDKGILGGGLLVCHSMNLEENKKLICEQSYPLLLEGIIDGEHKIRLEAEDKNGKSFSKEIFFYLTSDTLN
jgi:hypothetical protein